MNVPLATCSFLQINIVVIALVIRQIMRPVPGKHVTEKTQIEKVKTGIRRSVAILPLLGITWLFGLLSFSSATVTFKYIFSITNSLQGLMIFVFHCLLDDKVGECFYSISEMLSLSITVPDDTRL